MQGARTFLKPKEVEVVIHHSPCNDGHAAAATFYHHVSESVTFIGLHPKDTLLTPEVLDQVRGKNVLFVDICFSPADMNEFAKVAQKTLVLDHHITNQEAGFVNSDRLHTHFVMGTAGVELVWQYLYGEEDLSFPRGLKYIALKDVWQHQDNWAAVCFNAAFTRPKTFSEWYYLMESKSKYDKQVQAIIDKGETIIHYQRDVLKTMMEKVRYSEWRGFRIAMVNVPFPWISDIGALMCEGAEAERTIAVVWNKPANEPYAVSLRTHDKVGPNVSDIAKEFKGGGHIHGAGLRLDQPPFEVFTDTGKWTEK